MIRIIPRLDVKNNTVVKGIHLEGIRVVGDPKEMALDYYRSGADEIIYVDAVASLYDRNSLTDLVKETAKEVFIPMTVGGGVRSLDDIESLLNSGADKVAINTHAVRNPDFIKEAAQKYGSQCIVLSVQAKNRGGGKYEVFTETGRQPTGVDVYSWVKEAVDLGAGEILLTCIDKEGTKKGMDCELLKKINEISTVPIIASGGVGDVSHIEKVIGETKVSAVALASILHYKICDLKSIKSSLSKTNRNIRSAFV